MNARIKVMWLGESSWYWADTYGEACERVASLKAAGFDDARIVA